MTVSRVGSDRESPRFFRSDGASLFGILARPRTDPRGIGIVVLPGGSTPLSTNRNRFSVQVCRELAGMGYHALRFDYHGAGESTGTIRRLDLAQPFVDDVRGAMRLFEEEGVGEHVLVGSCFGARTALSGAAATPSVRGVVLISAPVRDQAMGDRAGHEAAFEWTLGTYARRALRLRTAAGLLDRNHRKVYARYAKAKWRALTSGRAAGGLDGHRAGSRMAGRAFLEPLAELAHRRVPLLFVFGSTEVHYEEFKRASDGPLGEILRRAGSLVEVRTLPGRVHGFPRVSVQEGVAQIVGDWVSRSTARDRAGSPS